MRVLFTTYAEKTHFLAMAPLAWALRTAGHEVVFAAQPKMTGVITQAGLTAVPVGSDRDLRQIIDGGWLWLRAGPNALPIPYDSAEGPAQDITWDYLRNGYDTQVQEWHKISNIPMIAGLVEFAQRWKPDLVIWEPVTYAGAIAARACGAAHARLLFSLDTFGVTREHFLRLMAEQPPGDRADPMADWLGAYARKYGFDFTEDLITGQFTINLLPPSLRMEAGLRYLPMRYVPYGGVAVVPGWLRDAPARPRVALTMGLSAADYDTGYAINVQDVLDSLADLDLEVVATVAEHERDKLGRVPGNARLVSFVPLHALVPTCTAVIHHGGYGTLATTALNAVPQLILSRDSDGPVLARRVARQGAGLALDAGSTTPEDVRTHLLRLLAEPGFRHRAASLRDEMAAMPSPNELAHSVVELAAAR